jgi:hypothetical protein
MCCKVGNLKQDRRLNRHTPYQIIRAEATNRMEVKSHEGILTLRKRAWLLGLYIGAARRADGTLRRSRQIIRAEKESLPSKLQYPTD